MKVNGKAIQQNVASLKVGFHLQKIFRRQERNRKAHGHARGSREQENFQFRSVPRRIEPSSTFSVLSIRER